MPDNGMLSPRKKLLRRDVLSSRSKSNRNSSLCIRGEQWKYFAHLWAVMKRSEKGGEEISPSKDLRAGQNAVREKTRK